MSTPRSSVMPWFCHGRNIMQRAGARDRLAAASVMKLTGFGVA
jgi:hypothetical protein